MVCAGILDLSGQEVKGLMEDTSCWFFDNNASVVESTATLEAGATTGSPSKPTNVSTLANTVRRQVFENVRRQTEQTIKNLQAGAYLDVMLVHWPVPAPFHVFAYQALIQLKREGIIKSIGAANYTVGHFLELRNGGVATEDMPAVNQIEVHPLLYRKDSIAFLEREWGTKIQAYRALGDALGLGGGVLANPPSPVTTIMGKHGLDCGTVLLAWSVQKGYYRLNSFDAETPSGPAGSSSIYVCFHRGDIPYRNDLGPAICLVLWNMCGWDFRGGEWLRGGCLRLGASSHYTPPTDVQPPFPGPSEKLTVRHAATFSWHSCRGIKSQGLF